MSRPTAVHFDKFGLYTELHSEKTKMMSGVELNTLYPIKETAKYYMSIPVWAHCASTLKHKKEGFKLSVEISEITNKETKKFLDKECWEDHRDDLESIALLSKLYPNKKIKYFYELNSIISAYTHGTFLRYDDEAKL